VAKRPAPRTTTVDGQTMYLVEIAEYEGLTQTRRQVGSYATRVNILRQQSRIDTDLLDEIRALLVGHPPCEPTLDRASDGCVLCRIHDVITRRDSPTS
jgi:hypothetical protein